MGAGGGRLIQPLADKSAEQPALGYQDVAKADKRAIVFSVEVTLIADAKFSTPFVGLDLKRKMAAGDYKVFEFRGERAGHRQLAAKGSGGFANLNLVFK